LTENHKIIARIFLDVIIAGVSFIIYITNVKRGDFVVRATRRVVSIILLAAGIVLFAVDAAIDALPFTTVYITRPGRFYHRRGCIVIRNGSPIAISVSNAREQGFYPCRKCEPPTW
jgi:hypothetical protein